jgi:hypothetical protein
MLNIKDKGNDFSAAALLFIPLFPALRLFLKDLKILKNLKDNKNNSRIMHMKLSKILR